MIFATEAHPVTAMVESKFVGSERTFSPVHVGGEGCERKLPRQG